MRLHRLFYLCSFIYALTAIFSSTTARAELVTLNVNSALSNLSLSGSAFGIAYTAQSPGSLTASYSGTITADLTAGLFTFTGGSAINAIVNPGGPYTTAPNPIGIEAGNYGVTANGVPAPPFDTLGVQTINGVYKDIVIDLSAGTATNGAATTATFRFTSATIDFGIAPLNNVGSASLAGNTGSNTAAANVTWDGTTLTIPVAFNVTGSNRVQNWTGTIVAVAVPEPSSSLVLSCMLGAVSFLRGRSRKRLTN